MASKKNKQYALMASLLISSLFTLTSIAAPQKLLTKQSIHNIRFFSSDNKHTYAQTRSGGLIHSTNYQVNPILEGAPGTNYNITGTSNQKKLIILKNEKYHIFLSARELSEIYVTKWGSEDKPIRIGMGTAPKLHLNDTVVSFYNPYTSTINFMNIDNMITKFSLKLLNILDPYFIPEVIMLSNGNVLYTDINDKGVTGIMLWDRGPNIYKNIWKASAVETRVELCIKDGEIFILNKSLQKTSRTTIHSMTAIEDELKGAKNIYESDSADFGNMICELPTKLYFIKEVFPGTTEAIEFNLADKKINVLTDFKATTQIINVDGILLVPHEGATYVIAGEHNFKNDSLKGKTVNEKINEEISEEVKEEVKEEEEEEEKEKKQ